MYWKWQRIQRVSASCISLRLHHYDSSAPSMPFFLLRCSCTNYKFPMIPAVFYIMSSTNRLPPLRLSCVWMIIMMFRPICRPLRAYSGTGDVMAENPSNLLPAESSHTHIHTRSHRLNMAVNKIVDAFSFGTIQSEIAAHVLAPRIISFLPPLTEVKRGKINNSSTLFSCDWI